MWQLVQVFQRTILLPLTLLNLITTWAAVAERASNKGADIVNREIDNWDTQDQLNQEANKAIAKELEETRKQLALAKAKSKVKAVSEAAKFTK